MFIMFPTPPICPRVLGSTIPASLFIIWLGFLIIFIASLPPFPRFVWPTFPISPFNFLCYSSRILTYATEVPDPFAIRTILESSRGTSQSSYLAVMESMMYRNFLIFRMLSFSLSLFIRLVPIPGSKDMNELKDPNFKMD